MYSTYRHVGELFTVGTCGMSGASAVGDTFLRVKDANGIEIASNNNAQGCNGGSNLSFVIPATGTYTIHAGCAGNTSCSGTVALHH